MEDLVRWGFIQDVLDITATGVANYAVRSVMTCDVFFNAMIENKIPLFVNVGALDMVNSEAKITILIY